MRHRVCCPFSSSTICSTLSSTEHQLNRPQLTTTTINVVETEPIQMTAAVSEAMDITEPMVPMIADIDLDDLLEDDDMVENNETKETETKETEMESKLATEKQVYVYKVNLDKLSDQERKSFATNILHCFSAVRNNWSTDSELAQFYQKFRPGTSRPSLTNVKENKNDWNRKMKKLGLGHDHSNDKEDEVDGCVITDIHRVCKRTVKDKEEEWRIHPNFAREIFSDSNVSVNDITVPIRNFKRKRGETSLNEDDDIVKRLKVHTAAQKRLIVKLKRKLDDAQKVRDEMVEAEKVLNEMREEVTEKERILRQSIKGKLPVVNNKNKDKVHMDEDVESENEVEVEKPANVAKSEPEKVAEQAEEEDLVDIGSDDNIFDDEA